MSAYRKKLIEVALPLEAINAACAREKSIHVGHPSTMHLWWARRPLAAARAVLFAQLVDDPSSAPDVFPTEEAQTTERHRLFRLIADLVEWENSRNEALIDSARLEIARSHARSAKTLKANAILAKGVSPGLVNEYLATELPAVHDPFAGGGTIPLEAQRLGLRAIASDLNPVAVMIAKALTEVPPRFAAMPPVNAMARPSIKLATWTGADGLAEDVRHYGAWMREEAKKRIGHLYPTVQLPNEHGGGNATVLAWIWARTVESPNPAFKGCHVPLITSFWLSTKSGRKVWIEAVVSDGSYHFVVRSGVPADEESIGRGTKLARGANFFCILSKTPIQPEHIKREAALGRMRERLLAVVVEVGRQRIFLPPTEEMERVAESANPAWIPDAEFAKNSRHMTPWAYGLDTFAKLFTRRQLVALTTFADLVSEARAHAKRDAQEMSLPSAAASAYGDAVAGYLGLAVSRTADTCNALCRWQDSHTRILRLFARQAIPIVWSFAEANPFAGGFGDLKLGVEAVAGSLESLWPKASAVVHQANAVDAIEADANETIFSTDPPYFDNVPYADLSDFFYVWLRRALKDVFPELFGTLLTPKADELIADTYRHGGRDQAAGFFQRGMKDVLAALARRSTDDWVTTIYYALKQSEDLELGVSSTGWDAFISGVIESGLLIDGTWPIRTEMESRSVAIGANALASSIVLVCRKRPTDAPSTTRGDFRRLLRRELPDALKKLQQGNIAPVDVAQASIGPGMAIFSRHKEVLEADGTSMSVRAALQLINEVLDEYLASGEGDFDADTRFAITWYEQHGWDAGSFGEAETLAKARNISVSGVVEAGICHSAAGKVRILKRPEMRPLDYDPATDERPTVWEFTQHMIRYLEDEGEEAAARLLNKLGSADDATRELAYRLYNTCERKKWAEDGRSYNGLILAWPELEKLAAKMGDEQLSLPQTNGAKPKKSGKKPPRAKNTKPQQELFEGDDE